MEKLLIVDGNSILNRAYYGIRMLNAPDGTPTNAVYGFLNILLKNLEEDKPDYICIAFDVKEKTFRHKKYDLYKAQRKPAPDDFLVQLPIIKDILDKMNIVCLENPGYEADDIIGTISRICDEKNIECDILTGDKDDLQLASENVKIKLVITRMGNTTVTVYDQNLVKEKMGVTPSEFIDVKGLMGDSSDNIPGVAGIGEKTAFGLIGKYSSIDNIYSKIEEIDVTNSVKNKLINGKEPAYLSRELATIDRFVPPYTDVSEFKKREINKDELFKIFDRLNFKSFISKLGLDQHDEIVEDFEVSCKSITNDEIKSIIKPQSEIIYKLFVENEIVSICFSDNGTQFYFCGNITSENLKYIFEREEIKKVGYDIKEDIIKLNRQDIKFNGIKFDVFISAYILNPTRATYQISELASEYLGLALKNDVTVSDSGQLSLTFDSDERDNDYKGKEVYAIFKLYELFSAEIEKNGQNNLYYDIELPLVSVLADMQITGVFVDKSELTEFGEKLKNVIKDFEKNIYEYAGKTFNINSPKQLGVVLFEDMKLPHGKKTKTGFSTSIDVLQKISGIHPIIQMVLDYRHMTKLQSTYVDGLLAVINKQTGRIHSNFNQTVTATGRISSTEPNLQNIPIRTELGRELRKAFVVTDDEHILVDADYSQIELRVLAHISGDKNMQSAFLNDIDIHTQTASQVFNIPLGEVTSLMRTRAKAVNFGIVYGIGEFSLSQDLKISVKEAKQYINDYLEHYSEVKKYMSEVIEDARKNGFITTISGRRRYIPELKATNKITQAFGERVAMNAPIQGSAADIIKIAMVNVHKRLKEKGLNSKLILQIHDELIIEAKKSELEDVKNILKYEMENAVKLSIPMLVDMHTGYSWFDTK